MAIEETLGSRRGMGITGSGHWGCPAAMFRPGPRSRSSEETRHLSETCPSGVVPVAVAVASARDSKPPGGADGRKTGFGNSTCRGKTALITGASRGIGAATARAFAAQGANVVLMARDRDAIAGLAGEIGAQALAVPVDVSRYWEVEAAVTAAVDAFGTVDILINNAGAIEPVARMEAADPVAWGQVIDINLKGVFHGMHAVLPVMLAKGGGSIITISSGAAHNPLEGWSHYCASKAGWRC
jgi:NADPH:quinone reductase-like Zn-dependent oxidoreductase